MEKLTVPTISGFIKMWFIRNLNGTYKQEHNEALSTLLTENNDVENHSTQFEQCEGNNNIQDTEWHWLPLRKKINIVFDFLKVHGIIKQKYARYDIFKDYINDWNVIEDESIFNGAIIQILGSSDCDPNVSGGFRPLCEQIWTFNFERDQSVEYGDFIQRLNKMTGNVLDFQDVKTIYREVEEMGCGVEFKYKSNYFRWDFIYNNDWTDFDFFHKFLGLVESDLDKKFYSSHFNTMSILYISDESATEIKKRLKVHLGLMT